MIRFYEIMKRSGWGFINEPCVYVVKVLSIGLKGFGMNNLLSRFKMSMKASSYIETKIK